MKRMLTATFAHLVKLGCLVQKKEKSHMRKYMRQKKICCTDKGDFACVEADERKQFDSTENRLE